MNTGDNATVHCCAECGVDGGVSLKTCKSCMLVKYCNADCQRKHWSTHKAECKRRAAELHDEVLFKDPLAKEDCPICFLPMPAKMICCVSLQPATVSSVPIEDFANLLSNCNILSKLHVVKANAGWANAIVKLYTQHEISYAEAVTNTTDTTIYASFIHQLLEYNNKIS